MVPVWFAGENGFVIGCGEPDFCGEGLDLGNMWATGRGDVSAVVWWRRK